MWAIYSKGIITMLRFFEAIHTFITWLQFKIPSSKSLLELVNFIIVHIINIIISLLQLGYIFIFLKYSTLCCFILIKANNTILLRGCF